MAKIPEYFTKTDGVHKKSQKQEKRVAKEMEGKVQKGSGSQEMHKGDVKTQELLIEAKRTDKDSISVKKEWLEKITKEAIAYNKIPALAIEFDKMGSEHRPGSKLTEKDWIAVPASFLRKLMDFYKGSE